MKHRDLCAMVLLVGCGDESMLVQDPPCAEGQGVALADDEPSSFGPSALDLLALVDGAVLDATFTSADEDRVDVDAFTSAIRVTAAIDGDVREHDLHSGPRTNGSPFDCPTGPLLHVPIRLDATLDGLGATASGSGALYAMGDTSELTWVWTDPMALGSVPGWLQDEAEAASCADGRAADTTVRLSFLGSFVDDDPEATSWRAPVGSLGTRADGDEVDCAGQFLDWSAAPEAQ